MATAKPKSKPRLAQIKKSAAMYENFHGQAVDAIHKVEIPDWPTVVGEIGYLDEVTYTTWRDGKKERYRHTFKAVDRPMLCADPTGRTLVLIGGNYKFTARGIVDDSDRKSR